MINLMAPLPRRELSPRTILPAISRRAMLTLRDGVALRLAPQHFAPIVPVVR